MTSGFGIVYLCLPQLQEPVIFCAMLYLLKYSRVHFETVSQLRYFVAREIYELDWM